jgi:uncharacterized protein YukE
MGMPPFFFVDVGELYRIAGQISRHADATRGAASSLAAAIAHDRWRGIASDVFSAEAANLLRVLRSAAGRLDDAADALRRHADRINGLVHQAERLCADAVHFGEAVVDTAGAVIQAVF